MSYILELLSYNLFLRAFVVGIMVSLCAALLGIPLVLKRYSMIGDGLSHVGFGALALASVLNFSPLLPELLLILYKGGHAINTLPFSINGLINL